MHFQGRESKDIIKVINVTHAWFNLSYMNWHQWFV